MPINQTYIPPMNLGCFVKACRWARFAHFPENLADWTKEHNIRFNQVAKAFEKRMRRKND